MYSFFYILVVILVLFLIKYQNVEHFLSNTIQLTDMTLEPVIVSYKNQTQADFFDSFSQYVPMVSNKNNPQIITAPKGIITNQYLKNDSKHLRLVTNLYSIYLTCIVSKDSQVYTMEEIVASRVPVKIIGEETKSISQTLFPNSKVSIIDKLPPKLENNMVYLFWDTEYSEQLNNLAINNKFIIIKFPKNHPSYDILQFNYPNLFPKKYNILKQGAINTERVIYSLSDTISIWSSTSVSEQKIYTLIKALFQNIEDIRANIANKYSKFIMEELRPENMIEIDLVPYHQGVVKYFREIQVYTNEAEPVCLNTITTIPCNADQLWDNRFRVQLYGSN